MTRFIALFAILVVSGPLIISAAQVLISVESSSIKFAACSSCTLMALNFPGICDVYQELTSSEIADIKTAAETNGNQTYTFDELIVCCSATSSATLMLDLIRYSNIRELTLTKCTQDYSAATADNIVVYGLEKLTIHADTSTDYPRHTLIMSQTDESDMTSEYGDYHVAFIQQNLLDGSKGLQSYSVAFSTVNSELQAELDTALQRGPATLRQKGDQTFLLTAIYGK